MKAKIKYFLILIPIIFFSCGGGSGDTKHYKKEKELQGWQKGQQENNKDVRKNKNFESFIILSLGLSTYYLLKRKDLCNEKTIQKFI